MSTDLQWNKQIGYEWAELKTGSWGEAGFDKLDPSKTRIQFKNEVKEELIKDNRHYLNGSGVAVGDINNDGLTDIYFASLTGSNKLYLNKGNYQFQNITESAGVAHQEYNSTGVVFADITGNGYLDLLVSSLNKGTVLYVNKGNGKFRLKKNSGLKKIAGAMTMTLADINNNGYLDLYVTHYKEKTARDLYSPRELIPENIIRSINGKRKIMPPFDKYYTVIKTSEKSYLNEVGQKDQLYLNQGGGIFKKVDSKSYFFNAENNSVGLAKDWGLTSKFIDINNDTHPDLYVANDFWTPDRMWINQGNGTFQHVKKNTIRNMSFASMGVDFSDMNLDGYLDFVVTEMLSADHNRRIRQHSENLEEYQGIAQYNHNSVYLNRGDDTFAQIAYYSGLQATEWSWATHFLDVDLDGYEDLIIAAGFSNDYQDMDTQLAMYGNYNRGVMNGEGNISRYPKLKLVNKIYKNNGDLTFKEKSREWGFNEKDISHGMALADLNNDGDLDLIINRFNQLAAIYENTISDARIAVRLIGNSPNTQGIGAKVVLSGGSKEQSKQVTSGGNYLSGSQPQIAFAADKTEKDYVITVNWRSGRRSVIKKVKPNRIYKIMESEAEDITLSQDDDLQNSYILENVSHKISHSHIENKYDDFQKSPLLPKKLSEYGPGVAWIDFSQNGFDDLLITGSSGHALSLYKNNGGENFTSEILSSLTEQSVGDQTAVIGWKEANNTKIVVGNANYEQTDQNISSAYIFSINKDSSVQKENIAGHVSTTGPLAAADYTGDGYVDLFIGGNFVSGEYPKDASSRLFINEKGTWHLDETNSELLEEAGLVSDALFADITGNGYQDLLLGLEWGSLRLFENNNGKFNEVTTEVGLDHYKGWWNGLAVGDFDNNGKADIVATNIGLNSPYQIDSARPLKMYFEDLNWDGRQDIVDACYDKGTGGYVPRRKLHAFGSLSTVLRKIKSHSEFSRATVDELFDKDFGKIPSKEINTLEHLIFLNTKNGFKPHPLPLEAQISAGAYAGVADFDNDGNEDLFIAQNFFAFAQPIPRLDAGRGLMLKGDGKGRFTAVPGSKSGIKIYGEQRGAALGDFNRDGRVDLVVSQNDNQTFLYQNQIDKKGITVRLIGSKSNKNAIGSSIRLVYQNGEKGPKRFIQAGGGYRSQNSYLQVMGFREFPASFEVTWFDGSTIQVEVSKGKTYYEIQFE